VGAENRNYSGCGGPALDVRSSSIATSALCMESDCFRCGRLEVRGAPVDAVVMIPVDVAS
jgi:hypothetical protein